MLKSLMSAFLMYSRIPMPQVEWKEENRRYSLCFFPLIGAVVGIIFTLWKYICATHDIENFLSGAVSAIIPILITGGIHLDGFCDVVDAKSSFGGKEKKLEIMSDPHIGSFAAMHLCIYFILQTALFCEIKTVSATFITACSFIISRALSGIAAVTFKNAKNDGSLQEFSNPAHKKVTVFTLILIVILCICAMLFNDIITGAFAITGAAVSFVFYRISAYKNFGGITGDLAGWFLQICEISILIFTVLGEKITEVCVL
ncbi:MAG: adenosylcobinamide-GDP ribazoletransferase [Oscillospiraceae bacterium]|nr:adenosylcobinamide-GDP ribazoletransferase [Oscillospiraceae bacterium]